MPERDPSRENSVTLEELLQLKKVEQPSVEFWESFQRDLHVKAARRFARSGSYLAIGRTFLRFSAIAVPVIAAGAIVAVHFAGASDQAASTGTIASSDATPVTTAEASPSATVADAGPVAPARVDTASPSNERVVASRFVTNSLASRQPADNVDGAVVLTGQRSPAESSFEVTFVADALSRSGNGDASQPTFGSLF